MNAPTASLSNVLVAAVSRNDQWRQLNALARSWAQAGRSGARAGSLREQAESLFAVITRLEHCWAYPGPRLLGAVADALKAGDPEQFTRVVQKISSALLSGDFRRDDASWDAASDSEGAALDSMPRAVSTMGMRSSVPTFMPARRSHSLMRSPIARSWSADSAFGSTIPSSQGPTTASRSPMHQRDSIELTRT